MLLRTHILQNITSISIITLATHGRLLAVPGSRALSNLEGLLTTDLPNLTWRMRLPRRHAYIMPSPSPQICDVFTNQLPEPELSVELEYHLEVGKRLLVSRTFPHLRLSRQTRMMSVTLRCTFWQ